MVRKTGATREDLDLVKVLDIQDKLINWYEKNHRKLPWRETTNPYYIWISEVMLQQTQVDTVIDYYNRFIHEWPEIKDLAEADEERVLKMWEGLGYYSRARRLHQSAKIIEEQYGGEMPREHKTILSLPGIGPYTAGAIASIAFGQPVPAVDGNVMRVFSRVFHIKDDISENRTKKKMEKVGQVVTSRSNPSFFNQGLMELGALICTPTSPKCHECPLPQLCTANALGVQSTLPVKKKKKKKREMPMEMALVRKGSKFLITKRPTEGLLANLWAFPSVEKEANLEPGKSIALELKENYGMEVANIDYRTENIHVFTHLKWHMKLYSMDLVHEQVIDYPKVKWVTFEEMEDYAFPTAFKKLLKKLD